MATTDLNILPIDELACEVVHAELKRREEKRQRQIAMN